jgi:adenylate kinase
VDVVLFGPPGAGKGTQATAICERLGVPQVATGDIFRRHLKEGTDLGKLAKTYMERGALVPDEVVFDIVASRLSEPDCRDGVLLDGFPRTVRQAELLVEWLAQSGRSVDVVIELEVPDDVLVARLSGRRTCLQCGATYHVSHAPPKVEGRCDRCGGEVVQRKDDAEETVRARLETYHRETAPVLAWLRERVPVRSIAGHRQIADVQEAVLEALDAAGGAGCGGRTGA